MPRSLERELAFLRGRTGRAGAGGAVDGNALANVVGMLAGCGSGAEGVGSAADVGGVGAAAIAGACALGAVSFAISGLFAERSQSAPAAAASAAQATNHGAALLRLIDPVSGDSEAERESGAAVVAVA